MATFELPLQISSQIELVDPRHAVVEHAEFGKYYGRGTLCVEVADVRTEDFLAPIHGFLTLLHIAARISAEVVAYLYVDGTVVVDESSAFSWGHSEGKLDADSAAFVRAHFGEVSPYLFPESYSRFANALRLHNVALRVQASDLALLGFVGAIESLFSIAPQELSFRLSLLLAKFLGDSVDQQRECYAEAKRLYKVRSQIAHGDRIATSEEAAAIQLSDGWVPRAEEMSRLSLRRVIEYGLIELFNSKSRHEHFLEALLFLGTIKETIRKT